MKKEDNKVRALTIGLRTMIQHLADVTNDKNKREKILDHYSAGVTFFRSYFEKLDIPWEARARVMQHIIDRHLDRAKKQKESDFNRITCRKGCSACCHSMVLTNVDEMKMILLCAFAMNISIDWERAMAQAEHTNESKYFNLPQNENQCVFLDGDTGSCRIYEHRPASCRKYFVISDPAQCSGIAGQTVLNFVDEQSELTLLGWFDVDISRIDTLPRALLVALEELKSEIDTGSIYEKLDGGWTIKREQVEVT